MSKVSKSLPRAKGIICICFLVLIPVILAQVSSDTGCPKGTFVNDFQCQLCPLGTYSNVAGAQECISCGKGLSTFSEGAASRRDCFDCTFGNFEKNGICESCPRNTYANKIRKATSCLPCPPGTVSAEGSSSRSSCVECRVGLRVDSPDGFFACTLCPAGQTTTFINSVTCEDCPAGTTSVMGLELPNSGLCEKCAPGTFAEKQGSPSCEPCPVGFYQNDPGSTSCDKCPARSTTVGTGGTSCRPMCLPTEPGCIWCPPGQGYKKKKKICERCPDGFVSKTATSTECVACPKGEGKANKLRTKCVCKIGFRLRKDGTCEQCPFRFTSDGAKCFCPATGLGVKSGGCECPKGEKFNYNKNKCVPSNDSSTCPNGIVLEGRKCKDCPGESIPNDSRTVCTCGVGQGLENGKCRLCEPGEFSTFFFRNPDQPRVFECEQCSRGTFSSEAGAVRCSICPTDRRPSKQASTSCLPPCPPGAQRPLSLSRPNDNCSCKPGFASRGKGPNLKCTKCGKNEVVIDRKCVCPSGTFSGPGNSECMKCPRNSVPVDGKCQCRLGFGRNRSTGKCEPCQPGEFGTRPKQPLKNFDECRRCPADRVTLEAGLSKCTFCQSGTEPFMSRECLPRCIKGFFRNADGICDTCDTGQVVVDMKCVPCPENAVSAGKDATVCTECQAGKVPNQEKDKCA